MIRQQELWNVKYGTMMCLGWRDGGKQRLKSSIDAMTRSRDQEGPFMDWCSSRRRNRVQSQTNFPFVTGRLCETLARRWWETDRWIVRVWSLQGSVVVACLCGWRFNGLGRWFSGCDQRQKTRVVLWMMKRFDYPKKEPPPARRLYDHNQNNIGT